MTGWLEQLGWIASGVIVVGVCVWLVVRAVLQSTSDPPTPIETHDRRYVCRSCDATATRYAPVLVERRVSFGDPFPFRRATAKWEPPAYCDLHSALAGRSIDAHLAAERLRLAEHLREAAERAVSYQLEALPRAMRGRRPLLAERGAA